MIWALGYIIFGAATFWYAAGIAPLTPAGKTASTASKLIACTFLGLVWPVFWLAVIMTKVAHP